MDELVTPSLANNLVPLVASLLAVIAAYWGWRSRGAAGLVAGLVGPLVEGGWLFHQWITRYDRTTGYFGLDQVKVLFIEVIVFTVIGVSIGIYWSRTADKKTSGEIEKTN